MLRFALWIFTSLFAFVLLLDTSAQAQTVLPNGGVINASIAVANEIDVYRFAATAGDFVVLRAANTSRNDLRPTLSVTPPSGPAITCGPATTIVTTCEFTASASGNYTVTVADLNSYGANTGNYSLYLARVGANEAGALPTSGIVNGTIDLGDLDTYTFTAARANTFVQIDVVDLGGTPFAPRYWLLGPTGALFDQGSADDVARPLGLLPTAGTYTLVVADGNLVNGAGGDYRIYFARAGMNEGGALGISAAVDGSIDVGDIDTYQIGLSLGQAFRVSVADLERGELAPRLYIVDANGSVVSQAAGEHVAALSYVANSAGTHTIFVSDSSTSPGGPAGSGAYRMYVAKVPGANEGGRLPNHAAIAQSIDLGDLDSYVFTARAEDGYQLQLASTSGSALTPYFEVWSPGGVLVASGSSGSDVSAFSGAATETGTFTVLLYDGSSSRAGVGNYVLNFVHTPGANENGVLANDALVQGTIDKGDLDSFTFTAGAGNAISIAVADTSRNAFAPRVSLYGPLGTLIGTDSERDVAFFNTQASTAGTYTIVIGDGTTARTASGNYDLYFERAPGTNEGGALPNGGMVVGQLDRGDLDSFTFAGRANAFALVHVVEPNGGPARPTPRLFAPNGSIVGGIDVFASEDYQMRLYALPASGSYTLKIVDTSSTRGGTSNYQVYFATGPGAADDGVIYNGVPKLGTIDKGDIDTFSFSAIAGQVARIEVAKTAPSSGFTPRLYLLNTSGVALARAGVGDPINVTIPSNGTYWLVLEDYSSTGLSAGGYRITLSGSGATSLL